MSGEGSVGVLLVCMGNICRSPMAEGVLRHRLAGLERPLPVRVDSAGTHGYHRNAAPDPRAQAAMRRRGIEIADLRARKVVHEDLQRFDLILAMDEDNLAFLQAMAGDSMADRLRLFMDFAPQARSRIVPDPYYGGNSGFERVLDLIEEATTGLLEDLARRAGRPGPPAR